MHISKIELLALQKLAIVCAALAMKIEPRAAKEQSALTRVLTDVIARAEQDKPEPPARRVKHVKRGSFYTVLGDAVVQSSTMIEEGDRLMVYRADDGTLWARPVAEFIDGRFIDILQEPS